MTSSREALRPRVLAGVALLAAGIFVVPYGLPPASAIQSASTIVGFNNALAYLLYLPGLFGTAWLLSRSCSWEGPAVMGPPARSLWPGAVFWWVGLAHAVGFLLLYSYKRQFVFAEGLYFQHVAFRVASGEAAYTAVNFLYGPATLYPVVFLSRLMPAGAAYAAYYVAVYLAGLYALYTMLRWCVAEQPRRDRLFLGLAVAFFNPLTGLNYTLLRHLLPALTILTVWEYLATEGGWRRLLIGAGALWMSLMYSPDVGVASTIGILALTALHYCPWLFGTRRPARAGQPAAPRPSERFKAFWVPGLALAMTLLVFAMIPPGIESLGHYAGILSKFSAGGSNTPVEVSVPLGALLALMVFASTAVLVLFRQQGLQGATVPLAALLLAFAVMQRAVFGKPDVLHIAYAALPVLIVCLAVIPGVWGARTARTWLLLTVLALALPLQYYHASLFWPFIARHSVRHDTAEGRAAGPSVAAQLDELVQRMGSGRAYYMHDLMYYSLPVYARFKLKHALYVTTPEEAFSEGDIHAVIQQLSQTQAAVIMFRSQYEGTPSDEARAPGTRLKAMIDALTASPLPRSRVHQATVAALHDLWRPFVGHVRRFYAICAQTSDLIGLVPRTAGLAFPCQSTGAGDAI